MKSDSVGPSLLLSFRNDLRACTKCKLHTICRSPVPWSGDPFPEIAILGEAPGQVEDREGKPFLGSAGNMLRHCLREAGINPNKVAYANAVNCWPRRGLDEKGDKEYIDACRTWMRGQVAFIQPTYLITVGKIALRSVRDTATWPKLINLHGKPLHWPDPPLPARPKLWPTYHPSAALRSAKYKRTMLEDLRAFVKWKDNGEPHPEDCFVCGDEVYRFDYWGIALCTRHAARQGILWPEDELPKEAPSRKFSGV